MKYVYILIVALIIAAIILVIFMILNKNKRMQNSKTYLQKFSGLYENNKVIDCLYPIRDGFKKGSAEYIAVDKAIFYLTRSIIRDYITAFSMIEKVFTSQDVKSFHASIIEREKTNIILMLQRLN